jgi:hypothetical protein
VAVVARKDGAPKRLAEEIARAKRIKELSEKKMPSLLDLLGTDQLAPRHPETLFPEIVPVLSKDQPWAKPTIDAFKAFNLDHRRSSDWYQLLIHLARVLFPERRTPGRSRKWTDERLCRLLADVAAYKRKRPEATDTAICNWLVEKWQNTPKRLRRVLQDARDPARNSELARMVLFLKRKLERIVKEGGVGIEDEALQNVCVSMVLADADKLWPA